MQEEKENDLISKRKKEDSVIRKVAFYSLAVNTFLVIVKLYLAWISGSLALEADAINSLIDIFASLALIAGIWLSSLKSSKFPYGLYKIENFVSIIIAFLVFLTAWEILVNAIYEDSTVLEFSGWVLPAVAGLASVPYLLGTYEVKIGKKYNSPGLIADGKQHKVDVLSTLVVFFALFAQYFGVPVDSIGAIIVAGFIAYSGWEILKDSMKTLLDASIDYKTRDLIKSAINSDPVVICTKELNARNSGRYIFVEAVVNMKKTDLSKAHLASERIESKIRDLVPNVERVVIHYEPKERSFIRYAVPLENREGDISLHFGEAPYFAILDFNFRDAKLLRKEILQNPATGLDKQKGMRSAEFLLKYKPDLVFSKQKLTGRSAEYVFESAGILLKITDADNTSELIEKIEDEMESRKDENR
ncbi:cation diffusion facilitator family transporter [Methanolacinia paynteri]|uniref:cation diffusion facilitator family transporter n=1 Tax=Methanolacinia paynteri TaxID=230356 RepID=UPI00064EC37E|nr:cation diffusion facilitator family transporter [Methanolacinia paynteri]